MNPTLNKRLASQGKVVISPWDIENGFTGDYGTEAGTLVKLVNANFDENHFISSQFGGGATIPGGLSPQWGTKNTFEALEPGDTVYDLFGVTLDNILEHDENGNKLVYNKQKKEELSAVTEGESCRVARAGTITFGPKAVNVNGVALSPSNLPTVKMVAVPDKTTAGKIDLVLASGILAPASGTTPDYLPEQILGSVVGFSAEFGGMVTVRVKK